MTAIEQGAQAAPAASDWRQIIQQSRPDEWGVLLSASAAAYGIGMLPLLVLPFVIGALISSLGLNEAQAGILSSVELGAIALGSMLVAPFMGRLPRRTLAIIGALLAMLASVFSMSLDSYETLLWVRASSGLGCGLALAAGNATVSSARSPEKLAAHMSVYFVLLMIVMMSLFARVTAEYGHQGAYAALTGSFVFSALWLFLLPQGASVCGGMSGAVKFRKNTLWSLTGLCMLGAMFMFQMRDTMSWAFVERIGTNLGYSAENIGNLLSIQAVLGLIGPLMASVMGARLGLKIPVLLAVMFSGAVTVFILLSTKSVVLYGVSVSLISITYFYALAYLTALAAELDQQGRIVAASGGLLIAGSAVAPFISGLILQQGGYPLMGTVAVVVVVLTLVFCAVPLGSIKLKAAGVSQTETGV